MDRLMNRIKGIVVTIKADNEQDCDFATIYGCDSHQRESKKSTKLKIVNDNHIENIINCFNSNLDWGYDDENINHDIFQYPPKSTNSNTLVNELSEYTNGITNSGLRTLEAKDSSSRIISSPEVNLTYRKRRGQGQAQTQQKLRDNISDKVLTDENFNTYPLKLSGGSNVTKSFNRWSIWNTVKVSSSSNIHEAIPLQKKRRNKQKSFGSTCFENIWNKTKKVFRNITKNRSKNNDRSNKALESINNWQSYEDFAKEYFDDDVDALIQYRDREFFTKTARKPPQLPEIHPIYDDFYHSLYIDPDKQVNINRIPILDRLYERIDNIPPKIPQIRKHPPHEKPPIVTIPSYTDYQLAISNNSSIENVVEITKQGKMLSNRLQANMKDFVTYAKTSI